MMMIFLAMVVGVVVFSVGGFVSGLAYTLGILAVLLYVKVHPPAPPHPDE
jgi:hypothetical protein